MFPDFSECQTVADDAVCLIQTVLEMALVKDVALAGLHDKKNRSFAGRAGCGNILLMGNCQTVGKLDK